jgi:hypothetical protein
VGVGVGVGVQTQAWLCGHGGAHLTR